MKKWLLQMLMNTAAGFLGKVLASFVLATPVVAGLVEVVSQGEFKFPKWAWAISLSLVLVVLSIWFIVKRMRLIKGMNKRYSPIIGIVSSRGWEDLGLEEWSNVLWRVRIPKKLPSRSFIDVSPENNLSKINIQSPPICRNCNTELEERNTFWGKYSWYCVGCGYKQRSKLDFFEAAKKVEKRVEGRIRNDLT
ncbi:hypothetical protein PaeCFBP13512_19775 [Paenibacillus sp. CFBP13512]|uniref:hypothetical protein n=1 Tax=Paenibacillus sp. CFBP13512 TaxID=2184007 RepID=UPI0010C0407A|nr:hypothetical protein [Paenibacillus sp. CFBP13512]TKJ86075.1 hypothetical protein PaeCFBP13512_19775 [Paenibacillus sp. CFBP13512]